MRHEFTLKCVMAAHFLLWGALITIEFPIKWRLVKRNWIWWSKYEYQLALKVPFEIFTIGIEAIKRGIESIIVHGT